MASEARGGAAGADRLVVSVVVAPADVAILRFAAELARKVGTEDAKP